jgi:predicted nicotinamide N-methyase
MGALDDVVLIAVIDWDPQSTTSSSGSGNTIRKLRIRRRDLETPSSPTRPSVCTVRDLRTCLRSSLIARSSSDNAPNVRVDKQVDKKYLDIRVYDDARNEYILMQSESDETSNLLSRFGSRIRVRLLHHDIDSCFSNSNSKQDQPALLAITGRYYPFQGGVTVAGRQILIQETPNLPGAGTGVTAWDGALLLARYLEVCNSNVRGCRVLELGAGCGVVGITAAALGAQSVLMTDLPCVLPLLQSNIYRNQNLINTDSTNYAISMQCCECDWYQQPLNSRIMSFSANVILVADCVWVQELVEPLLTTLHRLVTTSSSTLTRDIGEDTNGGDGSDDVHVLISYQRRGKGTHEAFWKGLSELFSSIESVDTEATGIDKPEVLQLLSCRL